MNLTPFNKKSINNLSGFTVVELMVTITIVVLATGIIMLQYSSFNSSVLLKSQAYLTAFDIREAQTLAVSVRGNSEGSTAEFYEQYGLHFALNTSQHQYLLFQDDDTYYAGVDQNPARYNPGEEIGVPFIVDPRFLIKDICATSTSRTCFSTTPTFNTLDISFKRPDFDAAFYTPGGGTNAQSVEIIFGTEDGTLTKTVTVYTTGQIKID